MEGEYINVFILSLREHLRYRKRTGQKVVTHAGRSHAAKPDFDQQAVTKIKSNSGVNFVHTAHARKKTFETTETHRLAELDITYDDAS